MRRPVLVVLLLTFVALVAATLWVPCRDIQEPLRRPGAHWRWITDIGGFDPPLFHARTGETEGARRVFELHAPMLTFEYALILAVGGLVALALHTRGRRRDAVALATQPAA